MRISEAFENRPLLIAYICSGDPSPDETPEIAKMLIKAGADIIELGLPHSDPIADGPVIQAAAQRAIEAGMNTDVYFDVASAISGAPKVFMGYYNMIYRRGLDRFAEDCASADIAGMIVPDLPLEESGPLREACVRTGVDLIPLIAPNTPPERIDLIQAQAMGFVYLVARSGVTGARSNVLTSTKELISRVRTGLPKAVGFGISTPAQAAEVILAGADAAIVGSACVDLISKGELETLQSLIRDMKEEISKARSKAPIVC